MLMCLSSDMRCWMMPPPFLGAERGFFEVWRVWVMVGPCRCLQAEVGDLSVLLLPIG